MEDKTHYIVAIEDLFRVPADEVSDAEEAEQYVIDRLGTAPFIAYEAKVVGHEG